ncbi:MAG: hypothetical protein ACOX18_03695 [Bacillota bacterium]
MTNDVDERQAHSGGSNYEASRDVFSTVPSLDPYLSHFGWWESEIEVRVITRHEGDGQMERHAAGYNLVRDMGDSDVWWRSYWTASQDQPFNSKCGLFRLCNECPHYVRVEVDEDLEIFFADGNHECTRKLHNRWSDKQVAEMLLGNRILDIDEGSYFVD